MNYLKKYSYVRQLGFLLLSFTLTSCFQEDQNSIQGYVEGEFVHIATSQSGRLDKLSVERGQTIDIGTPLFLLESENESAQKRQAAHLLSASRSQLEDLKSGQRPQELDVTRAQLKQAIAESENASTQLERNKKQFEIGAISKAQLDDSQTMMETTQSRVLQLNNQIIVGELTAREEQIKAAAQQVDAAQAALDQAIWKLNQKIVNSPCSGLVFDTLYHEGEWVSAGKPIVRMLPPENIKVRFFVSEKMLSDIKVGQNIRIKTSGSIGTLAATITYISTQAEYTPPVIYSNENRNKLVFMVEAHTEKQVAASLHPGQPILVEIK